MTNRFLLCSLLLIMGINLLAQEFPERNSELVQVFPVGKKDGFFSLTPTSKDVYGPATFCFDSKGFLVVVDSGNKRICIFDNNYNFISSINNSPIVEPYRIEIDKNDNIIGYIYKGIQKMDATGKELITIYVENNDIRDSIRSDGFYIADNLVFAYTRDNRGLIGFLNPGPDYKENNKNVLNTQEVAREIERNHPNLNIERRIDQPPTLLQRRDFRSPAVPTRQSEEYIVIENGVELSRNFDSLIKPDSPEGIVQNRMVVDNDLIALFEEYSKKRSKILFGTDNDSNTYWSLHRRIFILDPSNNPIAAFEIERRELQRRIGPAVSPSGDIYYMFSDKTGHYLYKYKRDW